MLFENKVLAGLQFTGATDTTGLFQPTLTGGPRYQIRINSLKFHTNGAAVTVTITDIDPNDVGNRPVFLTEAGVFSMHVPGAFFLDKRETNDTWGLQFVTTGMTGDGWLTIDWDDTPTES